MPTISFANRQQIKSSSESERTSARHVNHRSSVHRKIISYCMAVARRLSGYRVERKVYWRYDLPTELTVELNRNTEPHETCTITINLLELLGMVVTAWVIMLGLGSNTPGCARNSGLTHADTTRRQRRGSGGAVRQETGARAYS